MIPTNFLFSSSAGRQQGLPETTGLTAEGLQLIDLKEVDFSEFLLAQFQPALRREIEAQDESPALAEEGKELPLLPLMPAALAAGELDKRPLKVVDAGETDKAVKTGVLPLTQLDDLRTVKEFLPPPKKVVLQGPLEHKEVHIFSKEQQAALGVEKLPVEKLPGNTPELLSQFTVDKTDSLKLIDKTVQVLDKPVINNMTGMELVQPRPLVPATTSTQNTLHMTLDAPINQAKWSESLAGRIVWMAAENHTTAKINLNPPELGPIEVRVSVNNDQTNVNFVAQHGSVRDAIEDAFPRLRDMFSQNGINLGEANVSDQSLANKGNEQKETTPGYATDSSNSGDAETLEHTQTTQALAGRGLVDHFV